MSRQADTRPASFQTVCRDSAVGIETRYELDGPGIESRWRQIFRNRPDRPWGPPSLLYSGYRVSFPGVKRPGRGVNHPNPSSSEVKERVEVNLYSPSGPSWPVLGRTLPFTFLPLQMGKVGAPVRGKLAGYEAETSLPSSDN